MESEESQIKIIYKLGNFLNCDLLLSEGEQLLIIDMHGFMTMCKFISIHEVICVQCALI